jgi:hypothetical protein
MNLLRTILLLVLILPVVQINAQEDIGAKIKAKIESGDAISLGKHFNSTIDLTTPSLDNTVSQNHGTQALKSFFSKYPPTSFSINHDGYSNDGSHYIIGTYKSGRQTFRVYILLRRVAEKYKVFQLQFDRK